MKTKSTNNIPIKILKMRRFSNISNNFTSFIFLLIVFSYIVIIGNSISPSSESTPVEDYENDHYNKTGVCESISNPSDKTECFSQTNETFSCCMVTFNGTYQDPTIIDLYPAPSAGHHRLRILGGTSTPAADSSHSTDVADSSHAAGSSHSTEDLNPYAFKKCIAVYKKEKAVTSIVSKYNFESKLLNSRFECNTTSKISPCGMANPSKYADCKSHSSAKNKCCMVEYKDVKTCGLDLKLENNNTNHLDVKFTCNASNLNVDNIILALVIFLIFGCLI